MRLARSSGFTIIEVLIVLTVTGLLFLSAAALISGRTTQTEFDQSSRDFQQQIQNAITQVEAGTYNGTSEGCTVGGSSLVFSGNSSQGEDYNCIFIGDVMQFGIGSAQAGIDTYVLGGQRTQANASEVTGLGNALPTLVKTSGNQPDVVPSQLEYGLHPYITKSGASSMNYSVDGGKTLNPIGAFAIVYSFASYGANGDIKSGSQQVNIVPLKGSGLSPADTGVSTLEGLIDASHSSLRSGLSPDQSSGTEVTICAIGGNNQYALVTIGGGNNSTGDSGNSGQLGVTLSILGASNGTTCPS
jgi:prepilin-type N-terminal cleavage/methylation domain-containing protein